MKPIDFQNLVWEKGRPLFRPMPWREDTQPYYVLVSEIMLQQTQVERVLVKFNQFINAFPTVKALADAPLAEVLQLWSGLGYNRRAKFLHQAAQKIVHDFKGEFPDTQEELVSLPGVGVNTAGALLAYSFNTPALFIETNVRTVFFQHWFKDQDSVHDKEIRAALEQAIDVEHPREWYWAIMDYGSFLKRSGQGANKVSAHYKKQAPLKGSLREMRGMLIKMLSKADESERALERHFGGDERFQPAYEALLKEGLIEKTGSLVHLSR